VDGVIPARDGRTGSAPLLADQVVFLRSAVRVCQRDHVASRFDFSAAANRARGRNAGKWLGAGTRIGPLAGRGLQDHLIGKRQRGSGHLRSGSRARLRAEQDRSDRENLHADRGYPH
jgi:hypothetical protein